jgi:hypothetical protein
VKHAGRSPDEWNVRRVAGPPFAGTVNTSKFPKRSEANAIVLPSGDQTGARSHASWIVSWRASPPEDGAIQRSASYSKQICDPSGEMAG